MQLYVRPTGEAQCLYDEKIELNLLGSLDIKRASHVEPDEKNPGFWYVDLSPVGGPMMHGYRNRAEALKAEADWLNNKMCREHVTAHG
jgi:hypothetical protein